MQLTYPEALASIIEHTEIGYTIRSQDRLWIVFSYDLWSEGDWAEMRYNRLYPMVGEKPGVIGGTAYDRDMATGGMTVPVWTTRAEAEFFAENWRDRMERLYDTPRGRDEEKPEVYVINLGDDARFEAQVIGLDNGRSVRDKPKFKGSEVAWQAMAGMYIRAGQWYAELEAAKQADEEPSCP